MRRAADRTTLIALATLLFLTAFFPAGGDACADVPSMRWTDACFKACRPPLYSLCQETLQDAPDVAELTAYVVLAARLAKRAYDDTVGRAARLIATGSIPGDQRQAYQQCIDRYATARVRMVSLVAELTSCDFANTRQEYADAVAAMESCGQGLSAGTPLVAMNAADRDLTMVAYDLGALIVGSSGSR
jgi:NADH:ubiquinone reductase (non-electrogenic)